MATIKKFTNPISKLTLARPLSADDYVEVKEEKKDESKVPRSLTSFEDGSVAVPGVSDEQLASRKGKGKARGSSVQRVPRHQLSPDVRHVFRFAVGPGASVLPITVADLFGICGGICTVANSTFQPWSGSVRLHSIRVYLGSSSTGFTLCQIAWAIAASTYIPDEEWNEMQPEGMATPMALTFKPPKGSLASNWFSGNSGNVCLFSCPAGTIVDVDVSFRLSNQFTANTISITTGTLGHVYYGYLDGASSHTIQPQGVPSTF